MSDEMAIEKLAEEHARLQGYFTLTRVPVALTKGGGWNSDIDVLGLRPRERKILVVEAKAWGGPSDYPDWSRHPGTYKPKVQKLVDGAEGNWKLLVGSKLNREHWRFKRNQLEEIRIILPAAWREGKTELERELTGEIDGRARVKLLPVQDLIIDIINMVRTDKEKRRIRYSDTALESFRWLTRDPDPVMPELSRAIRGN